MNTLKQRRVNIVGTTALFLFVFSTALKNELPNSLTKLIPIVSMLLAIIVARANIPRRMSFNYDRWFVLFLAWWALGVVYTPDTTRAFSIVSSSVLGYIICSCLYRFTINYQFILAFFSVVCILSSLTVILQPVCPAEIESIRFMLMDKSNAFYESGDAWTRNNWYTGIFAERAPAAFYGSMSICMGLVYYYFNKYKWNNRYVSIFVFSMIVVGAWAIFLTAKRGLLAGSFIAMLFCIVALLKAQRKPVVKIFFTTFAVSGFTLFVLLNLEVTQTILLRFTDNDDILTNRGDIWTRLMTVAMDNFIVGVGTGGANTYLHVGGHNIYMTLLMENGIIGVSLFVICLVSLMSYTYNMVTASQKYQIWTNIPFLIMSLYIQFFFISYGMSGNPLYDNYIFYIYLLSALLTKMCSYNINCVKLQCAL